MAEWTFACEKETKDPRRIIIPTFFPFSSPEPNNPIRGATSLYGNDDLHRLSRSVHDKKKTLPPFVPGQSNYDTAAIRSFFIPVENHPAAGGGINRKIVILLLVSHGCLSCCSVRVIFLSISHYFYLSLLVRQ